MSLCQLLVLLLPLGQAELDTKFQSHLFFPTRVNLAIWQEKKATSSEVDIIHCGWRCMDLQVRTYLRRFLHKYLRSTALVSSCIVFRDHRSSILYYVARNSVQETLHFFLNFFYLWFYC